VRDGLSEVARRLREQLPVVFAREVDRLATGERQIVLAGVEAVTAWAAWDSLRTEQGLSVAAARGAVVHAVIAIVTRRPATD
jgi:hypothetical protein